MEDNEENEFKVKVIECLSSLLINQANIFRMLLAIAKSTQYDDIEQTSFQMVDEDEICKIGANFVWPDETMENIENELKK